MPHHQSIRDEAMRSLVLHYQRRDALLKASLTAAVVMFGADALYIFQHWFS